MPGGRGAAHDLIPALGFVHPAFLTALTGHAFSSLDPVYWTLYLEVSFYVLYGALHVVLGPARALAALATVWALVLGGYVAVSLAPGLAIGRVMTPMLWLRGENYGWFVSGALFYHAQRSGDERLRLLAIATGLLSAATYFNPVSGSPAGRLLLVGCVILFAAAPRTPWLRTVLDGRLLLRTAGAISYPLYLVHNAIGLGLLGWPGSVAPGWPALAYPAVVSPLMVALAWMIARHGEPVVRAWLVRLRPRATP